MSKMTARELLNPQGDDYDRAVRQWEERVQAAIDRDERLTQLLRDVLDYMDETPGLGKRIVDAIGDVP